MLVTRKTVSNVLRDAIANFVVQTISRGWPSIDKRDIEQDFLEVRFGNGRPNHLRHLVKNSFAGKPLA
jgi:hypothetical protein